MTTSQQACRRGAALLSLGIFFGTVTACQTEAPAAAQIETVAMTAGQQGDADAEQRLRAWARAGEPVAQRELGILYRARPHKRAKAMRLLEQAAHVGDSEAAFQLGEMERIAVPGSTPQPARAWPWYEMAASGRHARAALALGLLAKNGDGLARDDALAARWLAVSSELGNAHAMFLLSAAYQEGRGVPRDPARSRALLIESAEHDYPAALQELALTMQAGDALTEKDEVRAGHLMKEATEHRRNHWNRF